jgi:hypothetical protein
LPVGLLLPPELPRMTSFTTAFIVLYEGKEALNELKL